jgi:hypothetical protein
MAVRGAAGLLCAAGERNRWHPSRLLLSMPLVPMFLSCVPTPPPVLILSVLVWRRLVAVHRTAAGILLAPGEGGPLASFNGGRDVAEKPNARRSCEVGQRRKRSAGGAMGKQALFSSLFVAGGR